MIWQNLQMALASIRAAKLRSLLTMLGIIIGVSSVVTVLAAGNGVKKAVTDQFSSYGANFLQVNPGQAFGGDSEEEGSGGFNFASAFGTSTLTEKDVSTVKNAANVAAAAPNMLISGVPHAGEKTAPSALTLATTQDMLKILNRQLAQGEFLNDQQSNRNVIVLGHGTAESLFGNDNAIGKVVNLRGVDFTVIGVMKAEEKAGLNLGPSLDSVVYIPFDTGKAINGGVANIIEIDITTVSADTVAPVAEDLKTALKNNHGGEEDFTVLTAEDQLKVFDQILGIVTGFVAAIAAISLLVGGIGVMNIMFVSVTERTREIGIRKAIGATRRHILTQFLIEAIVISLIGGLLGVAVALGQGLLINKLADFQPVFSINAFVTAVVISTLVGIIFGTAPAIKAARKQPVEALRYE